MAGLRIVCGSQTRVGLRHRVFEPRLYDSFGVGVLRVEPGVPVGSITFFAYVVTSNDISDELIALILSTDKRLSPVM